MNYQDLMEWVNAEPFEPFRLVMTDGRAFDIASRSLIWPGRHTVMIGLPDDPAEPDVPGKHVTAAMHHVVRVEPLPQPAAAP